MRGTCPVCTTRSAARQDPARGRARRLSAAGDGRGGLLLLTGEAGIGKTALGATLPSEGDATDPRQRFALFDTVAELLATAAGTVGGVTDARVVDHPAALRYEVWAGDDLAGYSAYARSHDTITFMHTEIEPAYEGHGLGSILARGALDGARASGLRIRVLCPFVRAFIERHLDEYGDLVEPTEP